MQSNKPARKRQHEVHQAPENLILKQSFEFVSQLPIQECIDRLKYVSKESAYIGMVTANKVAFSWKERGTLVGGKTWAVGYIEETESHTRIFGITGISLKDFFIYAVPLVLIPLIIGFGQHQLLAFMASVAFISSALILFAIGESDARTRPMLLADIQGMFEAKKRH